MKRRAESKPPSVDAAHLSAPLHDPPWAVWTKFAVAVVSLGLISLAVLAGLHVDLGQLSTGALVPTLSLVFVATMAIRVGLWLAYRPAPRVPDDALPTMTVVVPAYNEGPGVARTLESLLASRYPRDRLLVIAVNDGSKDDTGPALDAARERFLARGETRLRVVHLPRNMGKRAALYTGFVHAETALVATVDSDSIVTPDTLAELASPFADPKVAGVAGRVLVWNRAKNVLTRMLHVRYVLGFDFVRAYQSVLRTVWCCPGAIQAYRRAVIAPHLDAWKDQRFLGARCTNGDDHALTNLVLALGHDTRYQATAPIYTIVPDRYAKLCKMFIRWGRSATRESFRALRFTPRRARDRGLIAGTAIAIDALAQPVAVLARLSGLFGGTILLFASPIGLVKALLASTLVALPYALVYLRSERSSDVLFGVLYGWFALFMLFWIQPFSALTVRKNGWLTRG